MLSPRCYRDVKKAAFNITCKLQILDTLLLLLVYYQQGQISDNTAAKNYFFGGSRSTGAIDKNKTLSQLGKTSHTAVNL